MSGYAVDGLACQPVPDRLIDATVTLAARFMTGSLLGLEGLADRAAEVMVRAGLRGEDLGFALEDVDVATRELADAEGGVCLPSCERLSRHAACGCEDRARDLVADAAAVVWARAALVCPEQVDALVEAAS